MCGTSTRVILGPNDVTEFDGTYDETIGDYCGGDITATLYQVEVPPNDTIIKYGCVWNIHMRRECFDGSKNVHDPMLEGWQMSAPTPGFDWAVAKTYHGDEREYCECCAQQDSSRPSLRVFSG